MPKGLAGRKPRAALLLWGLLHLRRRDRHALDAAAGGRLVGVVEHEAAAQLLAHEIHLGADEEHDRLGIDEYLHALVLDHFLERLRVLRVIHRVAHARAAAVLNAHANALIFALGVRHDLADARRRGVRKADRLGPLALGSDRYRRGFHQNMFSSSFADSLMQSGVQGGSKVMLTVTLPMRGTVSSAAFTMPGISPATGQAGAVSVMSTVTSLLSAT